MRFCLIAYSFFTIYIYIYIYIYKCLCSRFLYKIKGARVTSVIKNISAYIILNGCRLIFHRYRLTKGILIFHFIQYIYGR